MDDLDLYFYRHTYGFDFFRGRHDLYLRHGYVSFNELELALEGFD